MKIINLHQLRLKDTEQSLCLVLQEEGLQSFIEYLKNLILRRAEEDYTALVEGSRASHCKDPCSAFCMLPF